MYNNINAMWYVMHVNMFNLYEKYIESRIYIPIKTVPKHKNIGIFKNCKKEKYDEKLQCECKY